MKTKIFTSPSAQLETPCLVAVVVDRGEKDKTEVIVSTEERAVADAAAELISTGDLSGKNFELSWLYHPRGLKAERLLLIGGGKASRFTPSELRKVAGAAVRALKSRSLRSLAFLLPQTISPSEAARAVVEGAVVGDFDPDTYKSDRKDQKIGELTLVARGDDPMLERAAEEARIIAESQNFTRELVNEPSNHMTPTMLANRARLMAQETGLRSETYGADKIRELKMGAFWGVAQGSDEPPALIILRHEPAGAPQTPVLGLVGKGITFDTGGISIKPADGMEKM
ncbi:MAG: aminopeptidase, partial [Acidobacteria bacterium]|nr:aminopeptidase [Acidobacteriota bacterium]